MYTKTESGPTAYFDVDDTLVMWDVPKSASDDDLKANMVSVKCRRRFSNVYKNIHNINLLKKMANRGHSIVVWSAGGSDWAEAVINALKLQDYVDVITTKPTYYIDDISDPAKILGKHGYFNVNGKRAGTDEYAHREDFLDE